MKKILDLKEGDLLTVDAASKLLSVPKKTLYEWHRKSKYDPHKYPRGAKIGGSLFFLKSALVDYLNKQFDKAS
jgi:predicted DNA-binding transcriptional regulator AlpA